ncbi:MAG: DMT family transporter [Spirochaetales bacterium]|nr:DMT family transporter [Spirochaetales bacterium]
MKYHLSALLTVFIWSITYISSKIVLEVLSPMQLTLIRFIIGYICLFALRPPKTFRLNFKMDINIILSAFTGIFLYYILENSATRLTQASYVSIIVSSIPLITSILAHFINKDEKFTFSHVATFALSFTGVGLIIFEGSNINSGALTGNILALLASFVFGFYNIFLRRVDKTMDPVEQARKVNFYGLIFITVLFLFIPEKTLPMEFFQSKIILNVLFLGVIASSLCILLWGFSINGIGAINTSKYIYLAPLITTIVSNLILKEEFTLYKLLGMFLIIAGVSLPSIVRKFSYIK